MEAPARRLSLGRDMEEGGLQKVDGASAPPGFLGAKAGSGNLIFRSDLCFIATN